MSVDSIPFTVAPAFEKLGAIHVLSRKVEFRFGQLVEALYMVCRKNRYKNR
jgi:hypothetical protein